MISDAIESWVHPHRYHVTSGQDVGLDAVVESVGAAAGDGALVTSVTLPNNGRGVYQAWVEVPDPADPEAEPLYREYFVDPGNGRINGIVRDEVGLTPWLYRGHMYLWQDHGLFGVFDPADGWCRVDADGHEPGGSGAWCAT